MSAARPPQTPTRRGRLSPRAWWRRSREPRPPRTPTAAGLLAGLLGFGLTAGTALALTWGAVAAAGGSGPPAGRAAGIGWLVAHRVPLAVAVSADETGARTATLVLAPLLLLALVVATLALAGRWAARSAALRRWPDAARALVAAAVAYGGLAALVAALASTPAVEAQPAPAALAGFLLAGAGVGAGLATAPGLRSDLLGRVPVAVGPLARAATAGLAVLVGGGALLVAGSLAAHWSEVDAVRRGLAPGGGAAWAVALAGAAYVPNAAIWAVAYTVGPGFAVGVGTSVAPGGVALDQLPAFPLLAALPDPGPSSAWSLVAWAVPIAAGVVVGLVLTRRLLRLGPTRPERAALLAGLAGAASGVWLGLLAGLSGGSLGAQRLADLGPDPARVAILAALEVGVVAAATAWEAPRMVVRWDLWREARQARQAAAATVVPAPAVTTPADVEPVEAGAAASTATARRALGGWLHRAGDRVRQAASAVSAAADATVGAAIDGAERPTTIDLREEPPAEPEAEEAGAPAPADRA